MENTVTQEELDKKNAELRRGQQEAANAQQVDIGVRLCHAFHGLESVSHGTYTLHQICDTAMELIQGMKGLGGCHFELYEANYMKPAEEVVHDQTYLAKFCKRQRELLRYRVGFDLRSDVKWHTVVGLICE